MKTDAGLRKMLDDMGCHAPVRFAGLKIFKAAGLCVPVLGIFIDRKYQTTPEAYLQAVVYHEVGHWRDPLVWLSALDIPALFLVLYLLVTTGNPLFLAVIMGLLLVGYFMRSWKERRADAYARHLMPDYAVYDKPFVPGRS